MSDRFIGLKQNPRVLFLCFTSAQQKKYKMQGEGGIEYKKCKTNTLSEDF